MKDINKQSKNWQEVKLKNVCELEYGKKTNQGEKNYLEIGDINIKNKSYNIKNKEKETVAGAFKVPKDTLLISTVRPTRGAITITKDEINVSSAFCRIKLKNKYLYYILSQDIFFKYLGYCSTGSTYPTCKSEDVLNYKFLYTENEEEQKKIAEILGSVGIYFKERLERNNFK
ncbi:restriction endonuclease subunit S [Patescibacteria group bacterium]